MLSVVIITKNEEANIQRCLESVDFADEIIVVDSGSTDATIEIAKKFTSKVYSYDDWLGYGIQKERALAKASGDWVLNLDADESVNQDLKIAILAAISTNKADAYRIPIWMHFYGKALRYSYSPKRHIRLFKREGAKYSDDIVHEKILLPKEARFAKLTQGIRHHSFRDLSHALYKLNRYSSYTARIRLKNSSPPSCLSVIISTCWMFFRTFALQRGFLDGKEGFMMAVLNAQGTFYRGMKQIFPDINLKSLPLKEGNDGHE